MRIGLAALEDICGDHHDHRQKSGGNDPCDVLFFLRKKLRTLGQLG
jgi:hypothetical protein